MNPVNKTTLNTSVVNSTINKTEKLVVEKPTIVVEKIEKPIIIKETILPEEKIEIQPVVYRERDQLEVHEVIQPMHERDIAATTVKHATLPAQVKPELRTSDLEFQSQYRSATTKIASTVQTEAIKRDVVTHAPIIEERINKKIIEEIQPVLYKETIVPVIVQNTQPIYEKVVEKPILVEEFRPMVDLGTKVLPGSANILPFTGQSEFYPIVKETIITQETFIDGKKVPNNFVNVKHII